MAATGHQEKEKPVVVVMVPVPAQGHLNQLLHFSLLISTRAGLPVHYIGYATHNRQAKERIQGWDPLTIPNIHFHDFSLPSFQTPPPDPTSTNKWAHLIPTFDAMTNLRAPLSELLATLSLTSKRVIVIHDTLVLFAAKEAASITNGEAYSFNSFSIFCHLIYKWENYGRPINEKTEFLKNLPRIPTDGLFPVSFHDFILREMESAKFDSGDLYNTSHAIEGPFINLLDQEPFNQTRDKWVIGPLNPTTLMSASAHTSNSSTSRNKCLQWLDQQPERSVLYVSFGSITSISDEQIKELAIGLENSGQRFIWVLRDADRGDIYAGEEVRRIELPAGYEERLKNRGMVVRNWAPQLDILAHKSTGGFMSHCGWNSCMESLSSGVPIAAWAMHSDQPWNSVLITEVLKVGLCIQEWKSNAELITAIDIESIVSKLMDSNEGKEIRKRAEELGVKSQRWDDGRWEFYSPVGFFLQTYH